MHAGKGSDIFAFGMDALSGTDTIVEFVVGEDTIAIDGFDPSTFAFPASAQSSYTFEVGGNSLTVNFLSPVLLNAADLVAYDGI